jgi:hypothetical protein
MGTKVMLINTFEQLLLFIIVKNKSGRFYSSHKKALQFARLFDLYKLDGMWSQLGK